MSSIITPGVGISDCTDPNSDIRFFVRMASLCKSVVKTIGLTGNAKGEDKDLEAAGQLVDTICTLDGAPAIVIANCAPRDSANKKHNGAPFCYFWIGKTLVIATIGGRMLSLVKKLQLTAFVHVLDVKTAVESMQRDGIVTSLDAQEINETQYRSLLFAPLVAKCILENTGTFPTKLKAMFEFPDAPEYTVWFVDRFHNRKLTTIVEETGWEPGDHIATDIAEASIPFIPRLTDVPVGTIAFTVGSSGGKVEKHFIELVVNGGDPEEYLGRTLDIGETIVAKAIKQKGKEGPDGVAQRDERRTAESRSACGS